MSQKGTTVQSLYHRLILPADANHKNTLYAGTLLRLALEAGYATAWKHVGPQANLVLRRVLNLECLRPGRDNESGYGDQSIVRSDGDGVEQANSCNGLHQVGQVAKGAAAGFPSPVESSRHEGSPHSPSPDDVAGRKMCC
jgi:hypothetical protein